MPAKLIDIANEVGVSVMTVSRALGDRPGVALDTKQRIVEAAKRLGYISVGAGSRTQSRTSPIVGLLINNVGTEYIREIIEGISNILDVASYDIVIFNPYRLIRSPEDYVYQVTQRQMEGLIVAAANILHNLDYLELVHRDRFPVVFIDQRLKSSTIPYVTANNWQGAFDATRYLLQLGHRRIGFVAGPPSQSPPGERLAGYRDALMQQGILFYEQLVQCGDFTRQTGYLAAQTLMQLHEPPTAIFACNDPMAFGVMHALQQAGKRVPDDVSVFGFDDITSAAETHPPLSTVRQPLREMGRMGAQILLDIVRGHRHADTVELRTSLILRDSCAPIR